MTISPNLIIIITGNTLKPTGTRASVNPTLELLPSTDRTQQSLTLIVDLDQLKESVIGKLRDIIEVDRIFIVLLDAEVNRFRVAECRGYDPNRVNDIFFRQGDRLIQWLTVNETYLILSQNPGVFEYLSPREKNILTEMGVNLIFLLITMNRITGMVLLSPKTSGTDFTNEGLELLRTLLGQAALLFENAYLKNLEKEAGL